MTADDGLNIQSCSPAKDAGNNALLPEGITTDLKQDARIENNTVDMGAYEAVTGTRTNTAYRDADGAGYGDNTITTQYACTVPSGYAAVAGDCDDTKFSVHPNAPEICGNGIDDNCNGQADEQCILTVNIQSASTMEGNSGKHALYFTVQLSQPTPVKCDVQYYTRNLTAKVGNDYQQTKGKVSFSKGQSSTTIAVNVYGDRAREGNEQFQVILEKPKNVVIGTGTATGTITDDDGTISMRAATGLKNMPVEEALVVPNLLHRSQPWRIPWLPANNQVIVTDMNGKVVLQARSYQNGHSFSNVASGIYVYQITTTDTNGRFKIFKGKLLITD